MGALDFLADWSITTIILASLVVTVLAVVGSYGLALGWRRWKERKRSAGAKRARTGTALAGDAVERRSGLRGLSRIPDLAPALRKPRK